MSTAPLVCLLSAAHPPDDVRVVRKEGAALAAAGWRVVHVAPGTATAGAVAGVALAPYARPGGWLGRLRGLPALVRRARAARPAVLHANEPDAWVAALLAARGRAIRVVLDVHEHYPSRLDGKLPAALRPMVRGALRLFCRLAARGADAVVVAKDGLDRDFRAPAKTIAVRNYAPALAIAPRQHAPGPVTLAHVGAIGVSRGWPQMLAALAQAPPGTTLRLIGRFTDGSEPAFWTAAASLGVAERVAATGWLPQPEALAQLAECDVGLVLFQPGERNHDLALPHKLFDCMLAGLPVIVPAFGAEVAAVVRESGCGLLVDTADPTAIASAIATLADPGRRATLGAAGREAALGRFGWGGEAARLVALYDRLAPLPPGAYSGGR